MTDKIEYPGAKPGHEFEPLEFVVTPELNQQYLYAEEDFSPIYLEATSEGPPIVHPGLLLNMSNDSRSPSFSLPPGMAGLHARDETFFYNPARVGKRLRVTWKVVDTYEKRGRPYKIVECSVRDEDGVKIMNRLTHVTLTVQQRIQEK
jgi:hypothetical protein